MNISEARTLCRKLRQLKIAHREYVRVCKEAFTQAALAEDGSVIMIVGPTRVGKSQVGKHLRESLVATTEAAHPRNIPLICVEAATTNNGFFSMKHLTLRALQEIKHPIFAPIALGENEYVPRVRETEQTYRFALERGLRARHTRYFIIDEAHHLLRRRGKQRSHEILDSLKSLGNATGVVIIFIGGYELLTAGLMSAHLNGRLRIIHFPRYQYIPSDMVEFDKILITLSELLPLESGRSLLDFRDSIHGGTLGNTGLIFEWNEAAIAAMVADRSEILTLEHYQKTRFEKQLEQIKMDIETGEKLMVSVDVSLNDSQQPSPPKAPEPKKKPVDPPFTRKLTRDPVGK